MMSQNLANVYIICPLFTTRFFSRREQVEKIHYSSKLSFQWVILPAMGQTSNFNHIKLLGYFTGTIAPLKQNNWGRVCNLSQRKTSHLISVKSWYAGISGWAYNTYIFLPAFFTSTLLLIMQGQPASIAWTGTSTFYHCWCYTKHYVLWIRYFAYILYYYSLLVRDVDIFLFLILTYFTILIFKKSYFRCCNENSRRWICMYVYIYIYIYRYR